MLLEKDAKFNWSDDCQPAFETLRAALSEKAKLTMPDFSKPFRLTTDASNVAVGAVLSQLGEDGKDHPIAFASKVLSKTERNWSVTEREAYAIVWAVNYFRSFLLGNCFKLLSDHKPLCWLRQMRNPQPKMARWILQLEEYEFDIDYVKGKQNGVADALSRLAVEINNLNVKNLENNITIEDLKTAQQNTVYIVQIIEAIKKNDWTSVNTETSILKHFAAIKEELFVDNDILYRQAYDETFQVILAPTLHNRILSIMHDSAIGGHLGIDRTVARIAEYFYWPVLRKITANYICRCLTCKLFKPPKENTLAKL